MKQSIVLYYKNGRTETLVTGNPEKAKRVYGAESYIPLDKDFANVRKIVNDQHAKLMEQ